MGPGLLSGKLSMVNVGLERFVDSARASGAAVVHTQWRPPAQGDPALNRLLLAMEEYHEEIEAANARAMARVLAAQPVWIDVGPALEVIPGFTKATVLHAGPPVTWERMCGPMRGAVVGALIYEGRAGDREQALALAASGDLHFSPCHALGAVGPMSGVITASMPVMVVENLAHGNRAYSNFNSEKNRKALSFGAFDQDVQDVLAWQRDVMAPLLRRIVHEHGGIDLKAIVSRALHMGDECHNRHVAATSILARTILPTIARLEPDWGQLAGLADYLAHNDWFFLNFSMACCKATMDAAHGIPMSTLVTAMARNGVESGIRVSGLGDHWFTAPAPAIEGLLFPPYRPEDANPDLGDSTITETCGIGAFAMAAAPAMVKLVGGTVSEAVELTREMSEITLSLNPAYTIPALDFLGTPTGIDIRKVVDTGIHPKLNTGIAHRQMGHGIVGAGMSSIPLASFTTALQAMYRSLGTDGSRYPAVLR
jgi:hypothetical protein